MILPEHIKIGFEIYNVALSFDIEGEGECHPEKGTILVKPGMSDRRYAATIIHEVLHACWDQAELPEGEADLASLKEEDVIARLSNLLTAALLDSPQLRQMLERVAGAANGTCWRVTWLDGTAQMPDPRRQRIAPHTPQEAKEMAESALERLENARAAKPDNEPRSEKYCVACGEDTPCNAYDCLLKT